MQPIRWAQVKFQFSILISTLLTNTWHEIFKSKANPELGCYNPPVAWAVCRRSQALSQGRVLVSYLCKNGKLSARYCKHLCQTPFTSAMRIHFWMHTTAPCFHQKTKTPAVSSWWLIEIETTGSLLLGVDAPWPEIPWAEYLQHLGHSLISELHMKSHVDAHMVSKSVT